MRRRGSLCGGCASACLLILIIGVVIAILFWRQLNSAIRGIYPGWPLVLVAPVLVYAFYRRAPRDPDGHPAFSPIGERLLSLLRANLALPIGGHTFRLYLICHGIPDRCFTVRGQTFPICARCTGLLIGMAAGFVIPAAGYLAPIEAIGLASLLGTPLLADGLTQLAGPRESSNPLRLATGLVGGLGLAIAAQALRLLAIGS